MGNLVNESTRNSNGATAEFKNKVLSSDMPLEQMAQMAGHKVGTMASEYAKSTASAIKTTEDYVKAHPLKGTAYAAAAGLVAGSLLTMVFRASRK